MVKTKYNHCFCQIDFYIIMVTFIGILYMCQLPWNQLSRKKAKQAYLLEERHGSRTKGIFNDPITSVFALSEGHSDRSFLA